MIEIRVSALNFQHHGLDVSQLLGTLDLGMRRQNLFKQGRSRAWQADDKDRVGVLSAPANPSTEEFGRTDRYLLARIGLQDFGAVTAFSSPQAIAARVVAP